MKIIERGFTQIKRILKRILIFDSDRSESKINEVNT